MGSAPQILLRVGIFQSRIRLTPTSSRIAPLLTFDSVQSLATTRDRADSIVAPHVSIGIFAWNEEEAIQSTLSSLLNQTLFEELAKSGRHCEVVCVLNGCTDRTPEKAEEVFSA